MAEKKWADMTQDERNAHVKARKEGAVKHIQENNLPSGLRVTINGQDVVLRPSSVAGGGFLTYNVPQVEMPGQGKLAGYTIRLNRGLSLSIFTPRTGADAMPEGEDNLA